MPIEYLGHSAGDIISALHESGYLMEQEVATSLGALGYHIDTNAPFKDAETGKSREIDVFAAKRLHLNESAKLAGDSILLCECKNLDSPIIFLKRSKTDSDSRSAPGEHVFPHEDILSNPEPIGKGGTRWNTVEKTFFHIGLGEVHYDYAESAKAVQFCRLLKRGDKLKAEHGGLYDSLIYPLAKALKAKRAEFSDRHSSEWKTAMLFTPVVCVSSPIFFVVADQSPVELHETGHVTFRRELNSEALKGEFRIEFVTQKFLPEFVEKKLRPLEAKLAAVVEAQPEKILNREQ